LKSDQVEVELAAKNAAEANKSKVKFLSPYNDLNIIRGQGSIGIEILQQCPKVDAVFVTVGGGGLISGAEYILKMTIKLFLGIAASLKLQKPSIKIYGCLPKNSPVMKESIQAGKIIEMDSKPTLSDGSAGGIEPGAITFDICKVEITLEPIFMKILRSLLMSGLQSQRKKLKMQFTLHTSLILTQIQFLIIFKK